MLLTPIDEGRSSSAVSEARSGQAMAGLVEATGDANFADRVLCQVSRLTQVRSWSAYTLKEGRPPEYLLAATTGRKDVTSECWRLYRNAGLYRQDRSFDDARSMLRESPLVLSLLKSHELPEAHRTAIYDRHLLQERLSLVVPERDGEVLAVNLYRYADEPPFGAADTQCIASIAPVLIATVRKHQLLTAPAHHSRTLMDPVPYLRKLYPSLTERELNVCAGLLQGWTFDGIAAHLGLSPSTVKTYRDRAFRTLGISHRNQLFAVCRGQTEPH